MKKRMAFLFFCMAATASCAQEDERLAPFILESTTLVAENGEQFVLLEDYADVIKKDIKVLREYDRLIIKYEFRVLDYGSFEVLFDLDFKVRNIFIRKPGPKLLNGIGIGDPLEKILEDFQNDPRYRVRINEEHSYVHLYFIEFEPASFYGSIKGGLDLSILVRYDENRKVSFVNAGWGML